MKEKRKKKSVQKNFDLKRSNEKSLFAANVSHLLLEEMFKSKNDEQKQPLQQKGYAFVRKRVNDHQMSEPIPTCGVEMQCCKCKKITVLEKKEIDDISVIKMKTHTKNIAVLCSSCLL